MRCKNRRSYFWILIGSTLPMLAAVGCGSDTGTDAASPAPVITPAVAASPTPGTFTQINQQIIQPRCISCHSASAPADGVNLSTYAGVFAEVVAGNPSQSILYTQVQSGAMPQGGAPLTTQQVQDIATWIQAGAQNN